MKPVMRVPLHILRYIALRLANLHVVVHRVALLAGDER